MYFLVRLKRMIGWLFSIGTGAVMGWTDTYPVQESFNARREAVKRENMLTGLAVGTGLIIIYLIEK